MDNAVQKHIKCEFCGMEFPQQGGLKAHMTFSMCTVTCKKVSLTFCDMIHSSEKRGLRSTFLSSEMLQNLLYL